MNMAAPPKTAARAYRGADRQRQVGARAGAGRTRRTAWSSTPTAPRSIATCASSRRGPSAADEARAPHRLYGSATAPTPARRRTGRPTRKAEIAAAHAAGRLPILVGGTGLYIRTLIDGIAPVPEIDPAVRAAVRALPVGEAHAALAREDPEAAARIRPGDTTRTPRALEVVRVDRADARGLAGGEGRRDRRRGRAARRSSCCRRATGSTRAATSGSRKSFRMRGLRRFARCWSEDLPALAPVMRAIGVREIAAFLRGEMSREQALAAGRTATRQYAKRQYTWFRRQPPADWPRFEAALDCDAHAGCPSPARLSERDAAMRVYFDADADPALIRARRVAIIGYGNQGRAQALNLRDSGVAVTVALARRVRRAARGRAADGFDVMTAAEAVGAGRPRRDARRRRGSWPDLCRGGRAATCARARPWASRTGSASASA